MGCSNTVRTTSQESIRDHVDISVCFVDSKSDLAHQLAKCFGQLHEQNCCRGSVLARVANKGGNNVVTSVLSSSSCIATLLRWEKLFDGFLDQWRKNASARLGGVVSHEQASIRVS